MTKSIMFLRHAAARGHPLALYNLGIAHIEGRGVPIDLQKAAALLQRSAVAGVSLAMINLALLYRDGRGVPQDTTIAREWLTAAAPFEPAATQLLKEL